MKENKCILKPNLWLIRKQFFEQKNLKKVYYQFISSMYQLIGCLYFLV